MTLLRKRRLVAALLLACLAGLVDAERQYFQVPPSNTTVVEGETALIHCVVGNQHQQGHTHWTKDGIGLGFDYNLVSSERYRVVGTHALGEYNLEISNAKLEDIGEFECQVLPTLGEEDGLRAGAFLDVMVPPKSIALGRDATNVEARSGRTFEEKCQVVGSRPKADIRWYKNGVPIEDTSKVEEMSQGDKLFATVSRLRWMSQPEDDGSLFTCQAVHPALPAQQSLKANFTLTVLYPPSFPEVRGYDGHTLRSGERLRLECVVANGNPVPEVLWYRNGKVVDRTYVTHATNSINDYEFTVEGSDHEATYTCHASNAAVIAPLTSSVRLNVFYSPENVEISGPDSARMGESVSLSCISDASNPPAKVLWVVNGKPVKENVNIVRPATSAKGFYTSSNVTIDVTSEKRDVSVVCSAVNEELPSLDGGRVSGTKVISILYPPDSVTMFGYDGSALKSGFVHRLTCVSSGGNPLPTISWYRGRRRITTGVSDTMTDTVAQSELMFTVTPSDNRAVYKCVAENVVSEKPLVALANLTVHFPPESLVVNVKPNLLRAGDIAHIVCESGSGNPAPEITWLRGRESVAGMDVHNKSGSNGGWTVKSKLYVPLTPEEDGMSYTCRASTPSVEQTINEVVSLSVRYAPIFYLHEPQQVIVLENETVTLNGSAYGNPDFIGYEWLKNGHAVRNSFYKSSEPKVQVSGALMIFYEIDRAHAGLYACRAQNSEGSTELTFEVKVRHSAEITHISELKTVAVGESVELSCEAKAFPVSDAMVSWHRRDYNMSRVAVTQSNAKAVLKIDYVQAEDGGSFTCTAFNGIGLPVRRWAWLIVKHAPVIHNSTSYSKAAAEIDAQAVLRCIARGGADITWQWQKSTGEQLDYDVRFNVESNRINPVEHESKLVVKKVQKNDYGRYKCIARNELGTDEFDIPLFHLSVPDPPSDLRIVNITHDQAILRWRANFDGGLPQQFRIRYHSQHSPERQFTVKPLNGTSTIVTGLSPSTKYYFTVEAFNRLGSKGVSRHSAQAETSHKPGQSSASQQGIKEDIPILVIVLVCFVGVILLALNAVLVLCFIRRHRNRKLQVPERGSLMPNNVESSPSLKTDSTVAEKAASVRLLEQSAPGVTQYATIQKMENGSIRNLDYAQHGSNLYLRPTSQFSDDSVSVRTVIEVDPAGRQIFVRPYSASAQPTYFNYQSAEDYNEPPSDAMYAESLRRNELQRQLASPVYRDTSYQMASNDDDFITPLMAPLRSISEELNNLSNYKNYPDVNSPSLRRPLVDGASPSRSCPSHSLGFVSRSPYPDARTVSSKHGPHGLPPSSAKTNAPGVNSPLLSTFSTNGATAFAAGRDYASYDDCLAGDVV